jgi:Transposase DDE domain group 1
VWRRSFDAMRLPANDDLERDIAELLTRSVGRPSPKPVVWYKSFLYQAASWKTARRVVAKVEFHFGELFPRMGFIVTNLETDSRAVVRFYNKRGTAEHWIKAGKQAVKMNRLSCHRFRSNEVRLWSSVRAYKPRESVATVRAAEEDRQLVADQYAAATGEDGWAADQARSVPLAAPGEEPSDAAALREHGTPDRCACGGYRVEGGDGGAKSGRPGGGGSEKCLWTALKRPDFPILDFPSRVQLGLVEPKTAPREKCALRSIKSWRLGVYYLKTGIQNGNSGLHFLAEHWKGSCLNARPALPRSVGK